MFGGINLNYFSSDKLDLAELTVPELFHVPATLYHKANFEICVKAGQKVLEGQLVSKALSNSAVNMFSPVSGSVVDIKNFPDDMGEFLPHIIIKNDFKYESKRLPPLPKINQVSVIRRMFDAGIVRVGEKEPCQLRYLSQVDLIIKSLVINCVETDVINLNNGFIFENFANEILEGVKLLLTATNASDVYFVFSKNQKKLLTKCNDFKLALENKNVKFVCVSNKYPMANEKCLIKELFNIEMSISQKSTDLGIIIENPATVLAIHNAVKLGKPFFEGFITLYNNKIGLHKIASIKNGTTVKSLADEIFSKNLAEYKQVVSGGLMSGRALVDLNTPVGVWTNSICFLNNDELTPDIESECSYCNKCVYVCPMKLLPMIIDKNSEKDNSIVCKEIGINACIECGCCNFVCPSKRHILQRIKTMKLRIEEENK